VLARVTRWRLTLPHEQFGGGLLEKYPQGNSSVAYPTSRTDLWETGGEIPPVYPASKNWLIQMKTDPFIRSRVFTLTPNSDPELELKVPHPGPRTRVFDKLTSPAVLFSLAKKGV
jgi:hypothetical protein